MKTSKSRPVDLMRRAFGTGPDEKTCGDCCNLIAFKAGNKQFFKCRAYGATCSNASDWRKKWPTCGMFGKFAQESIITFAMKQMTYKSPDTERIHVVRFYYDIIQKWFVNNGEKLCEKGRCIAWMPLPAPYDRRPPEGEA